MQAALTILGRFLDRSNRPGGFSSPSPATLAAGLRLSGLLLVVQVLTAGMAAARPEPGASGVRFTFKAPAAGSVFLAGEFNSWSTSASPMARQADGSWELTVPLAPGTYRYKFVIDGTRWERDPDNPAGVDDNFGGLNSIFILRPDGSILLQEEDPDAPLTPPSDEYPATSGTIYLNIIWHQHQPLYLDPAADQLRGPWVRTHATKDYYDMASILEGFPDVHCNVNLTSSLLLQLQKYYVDRLGPYYDARANRMDARRYLSERGGHTDPWVDLCLSPTSSFGDREKALLVRDAWNAFGISEVMIGRFPEYLALRDRPRTSLDEADLLQIKCWFFLAWFDPDFLRGPVTLATGNTVDLTDLIREEGDGTFHLRRPFTEDDANRLVAEAWKVMAAVVPVHRKLMFDPVSGSGQIEIMTTPFYHPILPLLMDSDLAREAMPNRSLPARFQHPEDAEAQVAKAVAFYTDTFGRPPLGMWPGEGSVAETIVPVLVRHGIRWMASADQVLRRSTPPDQPVFHPYRVDADREPGSPSGQAMAIVFRDTPLSDKIGFRYQSVKPEEAADDFIRSILAQAPATPAGDRLLTVILDGENAWEWYRLDNDAGQFLRAVYRKLSKLHATRQIVTVTTGEYLAGNPARGVPAHPVDSLRELEPLWAGSWINASFDTWIGEPDENRAWEMLRQVRDDLRSSGLKAPQPGQAVPEAPSSPDDYRILAWEAMYAAEGSDWFWWYGGDQNAPGGDEPFDLAFVHHLRSVQEHAARAGAPLPSRPIQPILGPSSPAPPAPAGPESQVMAPGDASGGAVNVVFVCDPSGRPVPRGIYIVGDKDELGQWTPNKVAMHDDGTHGDEQAGDGLWSATFSWPAGTRVKYKYTNSGEAGSWSPSEEFPVTDRVIEVRDDGAGRMVVRDTFGVIN